MLVQEVRGPAKSSRGMSRPESKPIGRAMHEERRARPTEYGKWACSRLAEAHRAEETVKARAGVGLDPNPIGGDE